MKNIFLLLLVSLFIASCATSEKMADESLSNAIVGQNEMLVFKRLGVPSRVEQTDDGGKIMVYEHYSQGEFLTPNKSSVTMTAGTRYNTSPGIKYTSNVNKTTNDPNYTIYERNVSYLKVYINEQGNCVRIENTLPQEQLDVYHERFKHFKTKE